MSFTGNSADVNGGAIAFTVGCSISGGTVNFTNNSAGQHGGGLFATGVLNISNSTLDFDNNSSGDQAGALYANTLNITGGTVSFTDNSAKAASGHGGGAIFIYNTATLRATNGDFLFQGNTDGTGATLKANAIYVYASSLTLAAETGRKIEFFDPITGAVSATLNSAATDIGEVIFDGSYWRDTKLITDANYFTTKINGNTTVSYGTLLIQNGAIYDNSGAFTVAADATVKLDAGTLILNSGNLTNNGIFINDGKIEARNTGAISIIGAVSGTGGLVKSSAGNLTLLGNNTYTGNTTINSGTLTIGAGGTLVNSSTLTINAGSLSIAGTFTNNGTIDIAGTGSRTITGDLTVGTAATGLEIGDDANLIVTGTANLTNSKLSIGLNPTDKTTSKLAANAITVGGTDTTILTFGNWANGTYTIISAASSAVGFTAYKVTDPGGGMTATLSESGDNKSLILTVATGRNNDKLAWGTAVDGTWSDANAWKIGGSTAATFTANDYAAFGAGTGTIDVDTGVNVSGMEVTAGNWTFTDGKITGAANGTYSGKDGKLVVHGGGSATFNNAIDFVAVNIGEATGNTAGKVVISDTIGTGGSYGGAITFLGSSANNELVYDSSNDQTLSGIISGKGKLTKDGSSTLILTGANSYTGGTTISDGTLQIGNGGVTGSIAGDVVNNATLAFNRSDAVTFAGAISGTGELVKDGAGTLTLSGASTYSGGTTIDAGAIVVGNEKALGTGTVSVNVTNGLQFAAGTTAVTLGGLAGSDDFSLENSASAAIALTVGNADSTTYSGVLSGKGSLTKTGSGTLTLSGANIYTGSTVIEAGTLSISAANNLGGTSDIKLNGGTLLATGNVTITGKDILLSTNGGTLAAATGQRLKVDSLEGTGNLFIGSGANAGTVEITGANTNSSNVTVNAGVLDVSSSLTIATGKTLTSGIYQDASSVWTSNVVTSGSSGTITFDSGSTWYVREDKAFTSGGVLAGTITVTDAADAQAALDIGNKKNTLYDFFYDSATTGLTSKARAKGDVNDAMVNTAVMFIPNAMGTAAAGRTQQRFGLLMRGDGAYRGQVCAPCEPCAACGTRGAFGNHVGKLSVWANYIGRSTELVSSSTIAGLAGTAKIVSNGVQFGADQMIGRRTIVGAMFNYEHSRDTLNASRVRGDNYAFAFYGAHQFAGGFDGLALVGYGHQKYASRRYDVGAPAFRNANFAGNTFEMTLETGRRIRLDKNLWMRPAVALDVYNNDIANFTEAGGLTFGKMSLTQAFARVGSDFIVKQNRLTMNSGLYYSYQMSEFGDRIRTTAAIAPAPAVNIWGSDLGRNKLTMNIGGSYALGAKTNIFGGYSGDYFADRAGTPWGHNGFAGVRWAY